MDQKTQEILVPETRTLYAKQRRPEVIGQICVHSTYHRLESGSTFFFLWSGTVLSFGFFFLLGVSFGFLFAHGDCLCLDRSMASLWVVCLQHGTLVSAALCSLRRDNDFVRSARRRPCHPPAPPKNKTGLRNAALNFLKIN